MADSSPEKPGLLSRLFGRKLDEPSSKPDENKPGSPSASWTEGQPDYAAAAALGEATPAAPTATAASPDLASDEKLPPELAGADLQPVEGTAPEIQGAMPTGTSPPAAPAPSGNWWRRLADGM